MKFKETNYRLEYIDVCKAIGIILVILGHTCYGPKVLYNIIYCFHMPLFFVIAGYVYDAARYHEKGFKWFVNRKIRTLLFPYTVFFVINLSLQIAWKTVYLHEAIGVNYIRDNIVGAVLCYSSMQHMPNCTPIWFLVCLFVAELIFFWLTKLRHIRAVILAILCMVISVLISPLVTDYTSFPWKFPVFLMAVFLMYEGYALRLFESKRPSPLKRTKILLLAGIICIALLIELLTGNPVGMNESQYGNIFVFIITALPISACLILICENCQAIANNRVLRWLGKNTVYIVGFNYFCRDIATEIYYLIPYLKTQPISYLPMCVITFLVCILCVLICGCVKTKCMSIKAV